MTAAARTRQLSLFGRGEASFDGRLPRLRRHELERGAWVDRVPGFCPDAYRLRDALLASTQFRAMQRPMYDRVVDVPRLLAMLPEDGPIPRAVAQMRGALSRYYGVALGPPALALYRDGNDSVAYHGDSIWGADGRRPWLGESFVAVVSLGEPRPFLLRPNSRSHPALKLRPGDGDLLVMGGTCQSTYEHAVPKTPEAGVRIALQFRAGTPDDEGPIELDRTLQRTRAAVRGEAPARPFFRNATTRVVGAFPVRERERDQRGLSAKSG